MNPTRPKSNPGINRVSYLKVFRREPKPKKGRMRAYSGS